MTKFFVDKGFKVFSVNYFFKKFSKKNSKKYFFEEKNSTFTKAKFERDKVKNSLNFTIKKKPHWVAA